MYRYTDFFFHLNLLPPYSIGSQGEFVLNRTSVRYSDSTAWKNLILTMKLIHKFHLYSIEMAGLDAEAEGKKISAISKCAAQQPYAVSTKQ